MINFFLDEHLMFEAAEIAADSSIAYDLCATLERLLTAPNCRVFVCQDFYGLEKDGIAFAQLLFGHMLNSRELVLRLQLALDRLASRGPAVLGTSLNNLQEAGAGGHICIEDHSKLAWWRSDRMCCFVGESQASECARHVFSGSGLPENELEGHSSLMFPNIYFHTFPSSGKLGLPGSMPAIVKHLGWLNDKAIAAFKDPQQVIRVAGSDGFDISPESPNTHRDASAMNERTIAIEGEALCCEWHMKFTKTQGRIHFCPFPKSRKEKTLLVTGNRVVVGVVAPHLK